MRMVRRDTGSIPLPFVLLKMLPVPTSVLREGSTMEEDAIWAVEREGS